MASIANDPNGTRRILFAGVDGVRRTIRLGHLPEKEVLQIRDRVESILASKFHGVDNSAEDRAWLERISDELAGKLARVGLVEPRKATTLEGFLSQYIDSRKDVKPGTRTNLGISRDRILAFFPPCMDLRDITEGQAKDFAAHLRGEYAQATASMTIKHARQFFKHAVSHRLIPSNPFANVKAGTQVNRKRLFEVTREVMGRVLDAATDDEWKLLLVLARYAGLRTPTEVLNLTWDAINWEKSRMLILAPKTEHHEHGGMRFVPIFPEVRPYLERAFERASPGERFVISKCRNKSSNYRTRLEKDILRAGLTPWPRLFQNLRSSCENDLLNCGLYRPDTVYAWIGHTERVAKDHYIRTAGATDEDFARGAQCGAQVAQKAAQHGKERSRINPHDSLQPLVDCEDMRTDARTYDLEHTKTMTLTGFEPVLQP